MRFFSLRFLFFIWMVKIGIVFCVMRFISIWYANEGSEAPVNSEVAGCSANNDYLKAKIFVSNSSWKGNYICSKTKDLTFIDSGRIYLNLSAISLFQKEFSNSINCEVRGFELDESIRLKYGEWVPITANGTSVVALYNQVVCMSNSTEKVYDNLHVNLPNFTSDSRTTSKDRFNVGMIVLDSLSSLAFKSYFPLSYQFLIESLEANAFQLHHKVADNSFPNIIPMLTGYRLNRQQANMPDEFIKKFGKDAPENWPLIWKHFKRLGYRTFFDMEDKPIWYLNSWETLGLNYEDLDFRMWPVYKHLWTDNSKSWQNRCIGNRTVLQFQMETLKNFVNRSDQPYFFYFHLSELTHDGEMYFSEVDANLHQFLMSLREYSNFNKTFLFVASDHGPRFSDRVQTTLGYYEERLPLMLISAPKLFQTSYPELYKNLTANSRQLTSHFDIHKTLLQLSLVESEKSIDSLMPNGISLLSQIPKNRTCANAGIPEVFCTCTGLTSAAVDDPKIVKASLAYVKHLNKLLDSSVFNNCHQLRLLKIFYAYTSDKRSMKKTIDLDDEENFIVEISTAPNNGIYRTKVAYKRALKEFIFPETVLRLNAYKRQSWCVSDHTELRKICLCKTRRS